MLTYAKFRLGFLKISVKCKHGFKSIREGESDPHRWFKDSIFFGSFFFRVFDDLVTYIVFLLNFETVGAKTFKVYTEIGGAKSDADSR